MAGNARTERASEAEKRPRVEGTLHAAHPPRSSGGAEDAARAAAAPERHEMIAVRAYFLAEARGFAAGCELDDWLRAEAEIDARLPEGRSASTAERAASGHEGGR